MKSIHLLAAAAACLVYSYPAPAQSARPAAQVQAADVATAPAAMVISSAPATYLPQGTNVRLRSLTELHSQHNRTGDRFDLEVAEDVMLNGVVIIPRGSPGIGEVTRIRHKGMWGRSGRLETRLLSLRANGVTIPITGTVAERGDTGTAGVVAAIVVLPVAGFFVTGTSAILPAGTGFSGTTQSDLPIAMSPGVTPHVSTLPAGSPR